MILSHVIHKNLSIMKKHIVGVLTIALVLLLGLTTLSPPSNVQDDFVTYSGVVDFTSDSTTTVTSNAFYIGSLYDQLALFRAQTDTVGADTFDVNVLVDFYIGTSWDQYAVVAVDSVNNGSVAFDTLSTINGVVPAQWRMAEWFRLRFDPQTGHSPSRLNYTVKIPRTGRDVPVVVESSTI